MKVESDNSTPTLVFLFPPSLTKPHLQARQKKASSKKKTEIECESQTIGIIKTGTESELSHLIREHGKLFLFSCNTGCGTYIDCS